MSLFRRSRATWRTGREIFLDCLPAILIFGVLYAFSIIITIMTPGFVPTGWNKSQYEAINALQYGIVGETLKIFSVRLVCSNISIFTILEAHSINLWLVLHTLSQYNRQRNSLSFLMVSSSRMYTTSQQDRRNSRDV